MLCYLPLASIVSANLTGILLHVTHFSLTFKIFVIFDFHIFYHDVSIHRPLFLSYFEFNFLDVQDTIFQHIWDFFSLIIFLFISLSSRSSYPVDVFDAVPISLRYSSFLFIPLAPCSSADIISIDLPSSSLTSFFC